MVSNTYTVHNPLGIHARPSKLIVDTASKFKSSITFSSDNSGPQDAKSILNLLRLAAAENTEILVEIKGSDEEEAMKAIKHLFDTNFGESYKKE